MKLNKERYDRLVSAIDEDAVGNSRYTFENFCKEKKLFSEFDRRRVDKISIPCPFHRDSKPSLVIEEGRRRFHCFGCGAHGGFLEFATLYDTEVAGIRMTKPQKANQILREDADLQAKLGFSSVFCQDSGKVREFEKLPFQKFSLSRKPASTYPELASRLLHKKADDKIVKAALIAMQKGVPPSVIEEQILVNGTQKQYSLNELNEEVYE